MGWPDSNFPSFPVTQTCFAFGSGAFMQNLVQGEKIRGGCSAACAGGAAGAPGVAGAGAAGAPLGCAAFGCALAGGAGDFGCAGCCAVAGALNKARAVVAIRTFNTPSAGRAGANPNKPSMRCSSFLPLSWPRRRDGAVAPSTRGCLDGK